MRRAPKDRLKTQRRCYHSHLQKGLCLSKQGWETEAQSPALPRLLRPVLEPSLGCPSCSLPVLLCPTLCVSCFQPLPLSSPIFIFANSFFLSSFLLKKKALLKMLSDLQNHSSLIQFRVKSICRKNQYRIKLIRTKPYQFSTASKLLLTKTL